MKAVHLPALVDHETDESFRAQGLTVARRRQHVQVLTTGHSVAAGEASRAADFSNAARVEGRLFLSAVLVEAYRMAARWWRWATPSPMAMDRRRMRIDAGRMPSRAGWRRTASRWPAPFAGHGNPQKAALRMRLNDWIRGAGIFVAVVDFDAVLRDPGRLQRLRAEFDSGDHLHPDHAGYRKMADAIDIDAIVARHPGAHSLSSVFLPGSGLTRVSL